MRLSQQVFLISKRVVRFPIMVLRDVNVVEIKTVKSWTCFFFLCESELPVGEFRCLQQDGVIAIRAVSNFDTSNGEKF
jgi:hypothetical protein